MSDTWQLKGVDDYRREISDAVDERKLRSVLEQYAASSLDIEPVMPMVRSILADCKMAQHWDDIPAPSKVSAELRHIKKKSIELASLMDACLPESYWRLWNASVKDDSSQLAHMDDRGPFAREDRLHDAKEMVIGLSEWATVALQGFSGKKGRRKESAPVWAGDRLARLYKRLTRRRPTRVTSPLQGQLEGYTQTGDFGNFARDLLGLVGMKLSDTAQKSSISTDKPRIL